MNTDEISDKIQDFISNAATYLLLSIKNWASAVFSIAMGLILTVYFILEGDVAYRWALSFFPPQTNGGGSMRRCSGPKCGWANGCWGREVSCCSSGSPAPSCT